MKKWLPIIAATVILSACSSSDNQTYYQLPVAMPSHAPNGMTQNRHLLWIEQVTVPDYLAGNGVAYQTTDVQYTIASQNLWASPLDQQLLNTLVGNLGNALLGWVISSQPLGASQDSLSVNVTGFHGRYDGRVVVSG